MYTVCRCLELTSCLPVFPSAALHPHTDCCSGACCEWYQHMFFLQYASNSVSASLYQQDPVDVDVAPYQLQVRLGCWRATPHHSHLKQLKCQLPFVPCCAGQHLLVQSSWQLKKQCHTVHEQVVFTTLQQTSPYRRCQVPPQQPQRSPAVDSCCFHGPTSITYGCSSLNKLCQLGLLLPYLSDTAQLLVPS